MYDISFYDEIIVINEILEKNPKTKEITESMTLKLLKPFFPELYSDFGDRKFKLLVSPSFKRVKDEVSSVRTSSYGQDKNGNMRVSTTLYIAIEIELTQAEKQALEIFRPGFELKVLELFMGFKTKSKLAIENRMLTFDFKDIYISDLNIVNHRNKRQTKFETLILGGQDSFLVLLADMPPLFKINLDKLKTPMVFQCLGFVFNDFDYKPSGKYIEFSFGFEKRKIVLKEDACADFDKWMEIPVRAAQII